MKSQEHNPSFNLKKTTLILTFVFLYVFHGYAQEGKQISFYFERDTVSVEQGLSFVNFLIFENLSDEEVKVENIGPQEKYSGLLLSTQATYTLAKGEKKRIPIKFLANTDFMTMKSQDISYQLSYSVNGQLENLKASFSIGRNEEKQLALYSFSRENYIIPSMTETTVSIFVENRSYSRRSIKLSFKSQPDVLDISPREQTVSLEPREKKLMEVKVGLKRKSDFFPDYNIQVEATDLVDNEKVGNTYVKVIALSNNRQVIGGGAPQQGKNFAEMVYNDNNSGQNYLQFRGNTEFSSGKEVEGRFNISGDYFIQEQKYNLYDTWMELERKGTLMRLGNIYGDEYDFSASGRGAKISTALGNNKEIEVLALQNNYSLYGNYFRESEVGKQVGAKYEYGSLNSFNGKVSYLFDHNPRLETASHLAHWKSFFRVDSIHNFQIEAGLSHEKGLIYQDSNVGASAGLNYRVETGKWDFQSTNSLSTKSYVGLNRGSFSTNQNVGYRLASRQTVFLQFQNAQVAPEYLIFQNSIPSSIWQNQRAEYSNSITFAQLGYQFPISSWNILISPKVEKQKTTFNLNSSELLSYRMRTNLGTSFRNHGLNLSAEYSYSNTDYNDEWFHSFMSTLSYRYKDFSLNGSVKANPSDVIDLSYYNFSNQDFINYNLYTSYNFQALNRNLTGSVAVGTNFSGLYKNRNQNFSGNLEYKVASSWAATAYGNYSSFQSTQGFGYGGNNYQFRVGVKKYFIKATATGNHKVSLQLFEDKNSNGKLDAGEKVLANEAVKLDDFVAITDKNGKVNFQNVPKGSYILKVKESAEARLMMNPVILVDRNLKLQVGLIKNNRVTGKLSEIKQTYDVLETNVRGVVVYARNQDGEVQSTVVNQNNEFEFFLKDGLYDIYIENDKYNYDKSVKSIKVDSSVSPEVLHFEYSKKNTIIKVKKF